MEIKYALNGKYHQYNRPFKISKIGTILSLLIFLLFLLLGIILENNIGVALVVLSIVVFTFFIVFAVILRYYAAIIKQVGSFEGMDIQDNKIIYVCERKGQMVISPENIERIKIRKSRYNSYTIHVYLKSPKDIFIVPEVFASQSDIMNHLKKFAVSNNITVNN